MLNIKNLKTRINETEILHGLNLTIKPGEVHAIMGPNGSGKSTLANVLSGREGYEITDGDITFENQSLAALSPEDRAALGVFLAFQYPTEIPGVNNLYFLKTAVNALRKRRQQEPLDAMDFMAFIKDKIALVGMDEKFLKRSINAGFSGGEKKRNEILQMLVLEPKLAILDETDSGLDIDALQTIAKGVNQFRREDRSILMITHYQRLLDYIKPDYIHVLMNGRIVKSGDQSLALTLEEKGYAWLEEEVKA